MFENLHTSEKIKIRLPALIFIAFVFVLNTPVFQPREVRVPDNTIQYQTPGIPDQAAHEVISPQDPNNNDLLQTD